MKERVLKKEEARSPVSEGVRRDLGKKAVLSVLDNVITVTIPAAILDLSVEPSLVHPTQFFLGFG